MKEIKILCTLVAFGLAAANVQAQALNIYCPLNIELVCQVQQVPTDVVPTGNVVLDERATTTKLKINTKTLLAMIATDEGFTLPPNAKLWLASDVFYIFRQDNTIFTNVNSGLLNITSAAVRAFYAQPTLGPSKARVNGSVAACSGVQRLPPSLLYSLPSTPSCVIKFG